MSIFERMCKSNRFRIKKNPNYGEGTRVEDCHKGEHIDFQHYRNEKVPQKNIGEI